MFQSKLSGPEVSSKKHQMKLIEDADDVIKNVVKNMNFDLDNSFWDAVGLESSWLKVLMADEWLSFYSALHRAPKNKLFKPTIVP